MSDVVKFHTERLMFAVLDGQLRVSIGDPRGHEEWLREDYGVVKQEFEEVIRGYINGNNIVFYRSSKFSQIDSVVELPAARELVFEYLRATKRVGHYDVFNGVIAGEVGTVWLTDKFEGSIDI